MSADIVIPTPVWVLEAEERFNGSDWRYPVRVTIGGHVIWDTEYTSDYDGDFYARDLDEARALGLDAFGKWLLGLLNFIEARKEQS